MRKLHLDNQIVQYKIYDSGTMVFKFESGKKLVTSIAKIKGIEPAVYERSKWKRSQDTQITPSELKTFVLNEQA